MLVTVLVSFSLLAVDLSPVLVLALVTFSALPLVLALATVLGAPCGPWERAPVAARARLQLGVLSSVARPLPSRMTCSSPPA